MSIYKQLKWSSPDADGRIECITPSINYTIVRATPERTNLNLPFDVNYGGRHPKEVESIEDGMAWVQDKHFPSVLDPFLKPYVIKCLNCHRYSHTDDKYNSKCNWCQRTGCLIDIETK